MNILLVDVDSKIPNLALMKLSAYYKSKGHEVGFNMSDPDEIYVSCVFKKNKQQALGIKTFYPETKIHFGGSGINYNQLDKDIENQKPDYDLYPSTYSQGFTTRGCIRNCDFCIVRNKEGSLKKHHHPRQFHDDKFNTMMLMDNNLLGNEKRFFEVTDWIIENELNILEHGMDIRLMTKEIAEQLSKIKFTKGMKFAFDNIKDETSIRSGIEILRSAKLNLKQNIQFYVLVGHNTTPEQDIYRCRLLKKLGTNAFVMPYTKTKWTNKIARWANRKWLYWSIDIDDYKR